jgi:hypothetical protein
MNKFTQMASYSTSWTSGQLVKLPISNIWYTTSTRKVIFSTMAGQLDNADNDPPLLQNRNAVIVEDAEESTDKR